MNNRIPTHRTLARRIADFDPLTCGIQWTDRNQVTVIVAGLLYAALVVGMLYQMGGAP